MLNILPGVRTLAQVKSRLWPGARVPYEFAETIDYEEWQIIQLIFSNISSVTNIRFEPRTARDQDYLLVSEDIDKFGCGCCSIGLGEAELTLDNQSIAFYLSAVFNV